MLSMTHELKLPLAKLRAFKGQCVVLNRKKVSGLVKAMYLWQTRTLASSLPSRISFLF